MELKQESQKISDYLQETEIIDYNNASILQLIKQFSSKNFEPLQLIEYVFQYVRDSISHTFDIIGINITCIASDVLKYKEGICFAKSHLLAAILRGLNIPTGFCYQRLIVDDIELPHIGLHGLNAVYIDHLKKWIRLDARGNKTGVDAQFSISQEQLAFPIRSEKHEEDIPIIFIKPNEKVISYLRKAKNLEDLINFLPCSL